MSKKAIYHTSTAPTDESQVQQIVRTQYTPIYQCYLLREKSLATPYYGAIKGPQDVANLVSPILQDSPVEQIIVLMLDSKNCVIGVQVVSTGIIDAALVHPREVFKPAIITNAAAIILAHNHPSGHPGPSPEDKRITHRIYEAGQIVGIELLDHVIVAYDGQCHRHISMKQIGAF